MPWGGCPLRGPTCQQVVSKTGRWYEPGSTPTDTRDEPEDTVPTARGWRLLYYLLHLQCDLLLGSYRKGKTAMGQQGCCDYIHQPLGSHQQNDTQEVKGSTLPPFVEEIRRVESLRQVTSYVLCWRQWWKKRPCSWIIVCINLTFFLYWSMHTLYSCLSI